MLHSIEEWRSLFATLMSSRVVVAAENNLDRSSWLASNPLLCKSMQKHCRGSKSTINFEGSFRSVTWLLNLLMPHLLYQGLARNFEHLSIVVNPVLPFPCFDHHRQIPYDSASKQDAKMYNLMLLSILTNFLNLHLGGACHFQQLQYPQDNDLQFLPCKISIVLSQMK